MNIKDSYFLRGEKERLAFMNVQYIFERKVPEDWKMYTYLSDSNGNDKYDVLIHIYDNEGRKVVSNIIEIKVRDTHYPTLFLEKKKYDALYNLREKQLEIFPKVNIFYLNFTPKATFLFDLKNMKVEWITKKLPASTVGGKREWIDKEVAQLDINHAKPFNYIFDHEEALKREKRDKALDNLTSEQNRQKCIFDSVKNMK